MLAALAGSALAPFVQAIATKVGEDVYAKIKHLLSRHRGPPPAAGSQITLADPATAIVLELPATLGVKDAYGLTNVRLPSLSGSQWLLVRYDSVSRTWTAVPVPTPPTGAIEVDDQQQEFGSGAH
ncbi:MAG TPA: hypothetical protein VGP26_33330 [Actinophytocola sp.]|nr:hypothetical protein [Actinophytocola sp.]